MTIGSEFPGTREGRPWSFRYTIHLGYRPPEFRRQFLSTLRSTDPTKHVQFAADLGVAGVLYPWALVRPPEEVEAVAQAILEHDLISSCVLAIPKAGPRWDLWADRSAAGRSAVATTAQQVCELALQLRSSVIAVLVAHPDSHEPADARSTQRVWDASVEGVAQLADIASDHGLRVGVEPLLSIPNSLLRSTPEALAFIRQVEAPNAGVIYDTGHVSDMGEDPIDSLRLLATRLSLVQFADNPGRCEPGAGTLPLVAIGAELHRMGYDGLVDLEHGWANNTPAGESQGLERLRAVDAAIAEASPPVGLAPAFQAAESERLEPRIPDTTRHS